jgi:hypothetical protein
MKTPEQIENPDLTELREVAREYMSLVSGEAAFTKTTAKDLENMQSALVCYAIEALYGKGIIERIASDVIRVMNEIMKDEG